MTTPQYFCPVVTALDESGKVDAAGNIAVWDFLLGKGMKGFLVLGSLGEFHSLPISAKEEVIELAGAHLQGKAELIIGVESNSQSETVRLANLALDKGATAAMLLPPYYIRYSQEELAQYFDDVLPQINGSVYLYNFPDCTGNPLSAELVASIASKHPNVVGIKDTVPTPATTSALIQATKHIEGFKVFSGLDTNFLHNVLSGGAGAIAGLTNLFPELIEAAIQAPAKGFEEASRVQRLIDRASAIYSFSPSLSGAMKTGLQARGVNITNRCAGYTTRISEADKAAITQLVRDIESQI